MEKHLRALGLLVAAEHALNACCDAQHSGTISNDVRRAVVIERDRIHACIAKVHENAKREMATAKAEGEAKGVHDAQRAIAAVTTYAKAVLAVDDLRIRIES